MKKFVIGFVVPVACYAVAFVLMDTNIWIEMLVGFLFMVGIRFSDWGEDI